VKGLGVEEKRVAGTQVINFVAMAVTDFTLEHIDEFHACVMEHRKRFGLFGKSNEIRLDSRAFANGVAEKLILMPDLGASVLDLQPLSGPNESGVSLLFELSKKGRNRDLECV
jgi:hypothetical protein